MEPGTTPLPPGMIRAYHYTDDLDAVRRDGLLTNKAKGASYGEPNAIWGSTEKPGDFKHYVEFHVTPEEIGVGAPDLWGPRSEGAGRQAEIDYFNRISHDFMLRLDHVPPSRFVSYSLPWHHTYRYIVKDPKLVAEVKAGKFDYLNEDPDHAAAIAAVKRRR